MAEQNTATAQQQASAPVAFNGPYETKKEHPLRGSILQAAPCATPRSMREGDALIGWGVATATYPAHSLPASAMATPSPSPPES